MATVWDVIQERWDTYTEPLRSHWAFMRQRADSWKAWKDVPEYHDQDSYDYAQSQMGAAVLEDMHLDVLRTRSLLRFASRNGVLTPEMKKGDYFDSEFDGPLFLTPMGEAYINELLEPIYQRRRASATFWVSTTIGLVGALTGLASVL